MIKVKNKNCENLVIAAVGDASLHNYWVPTQNNNYDIFLINYGKNNCYKKDAKYYLEKTGYKFNLIHKVFEDNPKLYDYKYIWMPDDDIHIAPKEIDKIFQMANDYNLWICQPSIMGWYGLKITLHNSESKLRFTNYVEIMCPCFESNALKKCIATFKENKSGWGIDHIWNIILDNPKNKLAILDDVVAIHTRPVGGGNCYSNFEKKIEQAQEENYDIWKKYNLSESSYKDLAKGKLISVESFGLAYHNTVEYSKVYKQLEAGVDISQRFWPPNDYLTQCCHKILR
jgi:hypothetical protein